MAWLLLVLAGLFEIAWAIGLEYNEGFRRPWGGHRRRHRRARDACLNAARATGAGILAPQEGKA